MTNPTRSKGSNAHDLSNKRFIEFAQSNLSFLDNKHDFVSDFRDDLRVKNDRNNSEIEKTTFFLRRSKSAIARSTPTKESIMLPLPVNFSRVSNSRINKICSNDGIVYNLHQQDSRRRSQSMLVEGYRRARMITFDHSKQRIR